MGAKNASPLRRHFSWVWRMSRSFPETKGKGTLDGRTVRTEPQSEEVLRCVWETGGGLVWPKHEAREVKRAGRTPPR